MVYTYANMFVYNCYILLSRTANLFFNNLFTFINQSRNSNKRLPIKLTIKLGEKN